MVTKAERDAAQSVRQFKVDVLWKGLLLVGMAFATKASWSAWEGMQQSVDMSLSNQHAIGTLLQTHGMRLDDLERSEFGEVRRPEPVDLPGGH